MNSQHNQQINQHVEEQNQNNTTQDSQEEDDEEAANKVINNCQNCSKSVKEFKYKIVDMQNELRLKEQQIKQIQRDNLIMEKIKIENEGILAEKEGDLEIQKLQQEIYALKEKQRQIKKEERQLEKDMTKQCDYLVRIEQKHKEVCDKVGVSFSLNQTRADDLQDIIRMNHKQKAYKNEQIEKSKIEKNGKIEVNESTFKQLQEIIIKKREQKFELEKQAKKEIEDLQKQQKQIYETNQKLQKDIKEKEKVLNMYVIEINKVKRHTKHNALQPIGNEYEYCKRAIASNKEIRREQKGLHIGTETARSWDNSIELRNDYQIYKISFWWSDFLIVGMNVQYKLKNGEKQIVDCFMPSSLENLQTADLKLKGNEYIASISGHCNLVSIEYLRIVSSRGNYIMVG
ncbi:hypothetical protein IMG5_084080 [Ichthyophthirius multifiliis]|uniref:Jacalin-type lectin domain-containing protein n=1 Tax=Ichthyophthirius multifiliis TaxID=5932 RepID=G0QQU5_ICHMU|nr:hypothetical protein IMG5_084080 [Ichthyophthirius multifiliis]EGR32407.1 hypothetical protein IMG5_084080 [Ichthyophthirius multifiliis]|eukprot:XP_004036393.1 hypothetical protein IMG5_084080 [Ichthyophthirius multifiliis]